MTLRFLLIPFLLGWLSPIFSQTAPAESNTVFSSAVYFDFGKHDLRPDADPTLSEVATYLSDKKNLLVKITAHTDSIGSLENNLALSNRRSTAVKAALAGMGVPDSLLTISTFGETMPAATNHTNEGRQLNRRATIEIIKWQPNPPPTPKPTTQLTTLEGRVTDKEVGNGLEAMVVVRGKGFQDTLYTDTSGYFEKKLPVGIVVGVDAYADCHFFGSEMTKTQKEPIKLFFPLPAVLTGGSLDLNNLYFVGNQPVLLEKSKPELPKILRFMESNPQMKIEIAGHVNLPNTPPVSTKTSHFRLSEDRAFVVYNYLSENGIADDRISYKGYGNWEMRYPNAVSETDQALNRRVELKVIEGGCQ